MKGTTWAILTGEYPPDPGGVSDYTAQVACALVAAGDRVHVFASPRATRSMPHATADDGVRVARLSDSFGLRGLAQLDAELAGISTDARLLVQYVPHAFGFRGMNVGFCLWLSTQRERLVDVMFHEIAYPIGSGQSLKHNLLGGVQRVMALMLARRADRIFVSTSWWTDLLRPLVRSGRVIELLPVPSNVPTRADPIEVESLRSQFLRDGRDNPILLGHFGGCGGHVKTLLTECSHAILSSDDRVRMLFVGGDSEAFVAELTAGQNGYPDRVLAVGGLEPQAVANHLAACDLLVQPYPDGVTTRRSSFMAGLALGIACLTTRGAGTEAIWYSCDRLPVVDNNASAVAAGVRSLIDDAARRCDIARAGRDFYKSHFDLGTTIVRLRQGAQGTVGD